MKAMIRWLHSPDVPDLEAWVPPDPDCFGFLLQVFAGPLDAPGEESFNIIVCTPRWLLERHGVDAVIPGRHHLLVFKYDHARLRATLESIVSKAIGADWHDVAVQLGRHGRWEFEDYLE